MSKSNRRQQDFPKCKIYTNHWNQNIIGGGKFLGGKNSELGKIVRPTKMLVFAMVIVFLTFLVLGIKFSRWGKNSLCGVKIHQVGTSETVRYVRSSSRHLQFNLCVLVYFRLGYTWPRKDEQKYRLIFLFIFCGISSCLARIWQYWLVFLFSPKHSSIYWCISVESFPSELCLLSTPEALATTNYQLR